MAPVSGCSPTATHSLQDMSAAAAAIALDMKPKLEPHPLAAATAMPSQKIKKLVRRNASDKLKLIQMVHDNPILWDSRLPNFKGAEKKKNRAWEHIGREFNAPGRRVARAFKSLRESYRRELAHVKLMGNGFKPKWSLYEAMDFLRDVIRERKGASHATDLSLAAYGHINNNNNNNNSNSLAAGGKAMTLKLSNSFNESAAVLNLSKCSSLNVSGDHYYCDYYVKPELDLSVGGGAGSSTSGSSSGGGPLPLPAHQHQAHNDSRVSSTRNEQNALQHSYEDIDDSSIRSGDEDIGHASDVVEELDAIDADFPYPLILDSNSRGSPNVGVDDVVMARKLRRNVDQDVMEEGNGHGDAVMDGDDYEEQMLQQHRHLRQQQGVASGGLDLPPPQTVREVLNSKFCGFISAKLNSMEDSDADNLMNRILLLLVQVQQCEGSTK
ncbi:GD15063 [Drosophila simulans]|uniref:GD15063 n=1 Tax=Drosophila simulans TaxID=7240 RepID=B4QLC3_DROSI|nr:GD15063 [Drosophila simulans]